jgi:hypothetical protein
MEVGFCDCRSALCLWICSISVDVVLCVADGL